MKYILNWVDIELTDFESFLFKKMEQNLYALIICSIEIGQIDGKTMFSVNY